MCFSPQNNLNQIITGSQLQKYTIPRFQNQQQKDRKALINKIPPKHA